MKLFGAHSIVDGFMGCNEVVLKWFRVDRKESLVPLEELIEDYQRLNDCEERMFAQQLVNEYFTEEEVEVLKAFLRDRRGGTEVEVTEVSLPILAKGVMPTGAIPVGGEQDFLMLSENDEHPLPFRVWGYYDLRHSP
jgi:hypothetical protein